MSVHTVESSFQNGVLVVEDVSEDDFDDSGVLVYSYKGKYVLMNFDIALVFCIFILSVLNLPARFLQL